MARISRRSSAGDEAVGILCSWIVLLLLVVPTAFVAWGFAYLIPIAGTWTGAAMLATWFGFWVRQWVRLLNVVGAVRQIVGYEFGV